ncbi:PREDICTED: translation initiation factor IF-2-like [Chinchilla lanigera]|uniref:translation initiation factor IF-2-like n=1 Tax=Chinchilla lanigera TaxID=34839 RepID=UPI0006981837|nr:PREDICTED: translation initiation factor IF-2-like [Chinchilla lanigera]
MSITTRAAGSRKHHFQCLLHTEAAPGPPTAFVQRPPSAFRVRRQPPWVPRLSPRSALHGPGAALPKLTADQVPKLPALSSPENPQPEAFQNPDSLGLLLRSTPSPPRPFRTVRLRFALRLRPAGHLCTVAAGPCPLPRRAGPAASFQVLAARPRPTELGLAHSGGAARRRAACGSGPRRRAPSALPARAQHERGAKRESTGTARHSRGEPSWRSASEEAVEKPERRPGGHRAYSWHGSFPYATQPLALVSGAPGAPLGAGQARVGGPGSVSLPSPATSRGTPRPALLPLPSVLGSQGAPGATGKALAWPCQALSPHATIAVPQPCPSHPATRPHRNKRGAQLLTAPPARVARARAAVHDLRTQSPLCLAPAPGPWPLSLPRACSAPWWPLPKPLPLSRTRPLPSWPGPCHSSSWLPALFPQSTLPEQTLRSPGPACPLRLVWAARAS